MNGKGDINRRSELSDITHCHTYFRFVTIKDLSWCHNAALQNHLKYKVIVV